MPRGLETCDWTAAKNRRNLPVMFNQREGGDPVSYEILVLEEGLGYVVLTGRDLG